MSEMFLLVSIVLFIILYAIIFEIVITTLGVIRKWLSGLRRKKKQAEIDKKWEPITKRQRDVYFSLMRNDRKQND